MATAISPYTIVAGEPFCAAIRPRDRRTHRSVAMESPRALMRPTGTTGFGSIPLTATVRTDRSILLELTGAETLDIAPGTYDFELVASISGVPALVASTTITVEHPDRVTPLTGTQDMLITYDQLTDYKTTFSWFDAAGAPIAAKDGWFRAENPTTNTLVVNIGWFGTVPNEATISALPANARGYVAPVGDSIELHFSDKLVVAPGTYTFDMLVQSAADDGWDKLASGTLVVQRTIPSP